jgi:hypothetical protein
MQNLRAGDWVEVRSKEEILRSLDENGRLEGLPFMPQMFQYCGRRFRVYKRAHKTCDTVNGSGGRWLPHGIHLDLRCDGKAYGGCQAACLIFWKEAWLRPIGDGISLVHASPQGQTSGNERWVNEPSSEENVWRATRAKNQQSALDPIYSCQATELPYFTTSLPWWDVRQYVQDWDSRNVTFGRIVQGLVYAAYYPLCRPGRPKLEPLRFLSRWFYDRFQTICGGIPFPRRQGLLPAGQSAPVSTLNLQPGELVRIKSYEQILDTIDIRNKNHGLSFDAEMVPYCGHVYRVRARVNNFINEKTGKMLSMKVPALILEGVQCNSRYSDCRMFCPRGIYSWWREIWLERVPENNFRQDTRGCARNTEPRAKVVERTKDLVEAESA